MPLVKNVSLRFKNALIRFGDRYEVVFTHLNVRLIIQIKAYNTIEFISQPIILIYCSD